MAGEAPLIIGGAGTAGEVTLLLRKSKVPSWHVLRPEGVHFSPAEELASLDGMKGGRESGL